MFLTRIGFGSKAVVTGDITQVDLPQGKTSGLREAQQLALAASRGSASCSSTSGTSSATRWSSPSSPPTTRSTASASRTAKPAVATPPDAAEATPMTADEAPPRRPTTSFWKRQPARAGKGAAADRPTPSRASGRSRTCWRRRFSFSPTLSFRSSPGRRRARSPSAGRRRAARPDRARSRSPTERRRAEARRGGPAGLRLGRAAPRARRAASCGSPSERAREAWAVRRAGTAARRSAESVRDAFELPIRDEALAGAGPASASPGRSRTGSPRSATDALPRRRRGQPRPDAGNGSRGVCSCATTSTGRETQRRELAGVVEYGSQAKSALAVAARGRPSPGGSERRSRRSSPAALRPNLTYNGSETARAARAGRRVRSRPC